MADLAHTDVVAVPLCMQPTQLTTIAGCGPKRLDTQYNFGSHFGIQWLGGVVVVGKYAHGFAESVLCLRRQSDPTRDKETPFPSLIIGLHNIGVGNL